MASKRAVGFYWVKGKPDPKWNETIDEQPWVVARWNGDAWDVSYESSHLDDEIAIVGERLEPPNGE